MQGAGEAQECPASEACPKRKRPLQPQGHLHGPYNMNCISVSVVRGSFLTEPQTCAVCLSGLLAAVHVP